MENDQLLPGVPVSPYDILPVLQTVVLADSTRQKYIRAVEGYLASGAALTDQTALAAYAAMFSKSRRGHLKSAVKKWTEAMATAVKGQATPDNMATIQASLLRFEALQEAIQVAPKRTKSPYLAVRP